MPHNRLEESICMTFMAFVRLAESGGHTAPGFTLFHIPNGQRAGSSKTSRVIAGGIDKKMGARRGVLDYQVLWSPQTVCSKGRIKDTVYETGFLEAKAPTGRITEDQKQFIEDMHTLGVKCGVFRSPEEGIDLLIEYGAILPSFTAHKR